MSNEFSKGFTDSALDSEREQVAETLPQEMIRSAAIRKDGVVYVCWAHCYNELKRMNLDFPEDGFLNCEQGFVTTTGRYVDRVEGLRIAEAANQIIHKHHPLDELLSEDLRPIPAPQESVPERNLRPILDWLRDREKGAFVASQEMALSPDARAQYAEWEVMYRDIARILRAAPSERDQALCDAISECEFLLESQTERTSDAGAGSRVAIRACIAAIRSLITTPAPEEGKPDGKKSGQ